MLSRCQKLNPLKYSSGILKILGRYAYFDFPGIKPAPWLPVVWKLVGQVFVLKPPLLCLSKHNSYIIIRFIHLF